KRASWFHSVIVALRGPVWRAVRAHFAAATRGRPLPSGIVTVPGPEVFHAPAHASAHCRCPPAPRNCVSATNPTYARSTPPPAARRHETLFNADALGTRPRRRTGAGAPRDGIHRHRDAGHRPAHLGPVFAARGDRQRQRRRRGRRYELRTG